MVHVARQSPAVLIGPAVLVILVLLGLRSALNGLERSGFRPDGADGVARILALVCLLLFARRVTRWAAHRYLVTNRRLVEVSGVLARRIHSVPLAVVTDVDHRRGVLGALLGYGSLRVVWARAAWRVHKVSRPGALHQALLGQLEGARSAEGQGPVEPTRPYTRVEPPQTGQDHSAPATPRRPPALAGGGIEGSLLEKRYLVERRIASGGMGTIFEGHDQRLGRSVAIKVLRSDLAHEASFLERFRVEARSAAALTHPNIASIYDSGEDHDIHYIIMELIRGRDLSQLLERDGPFDPARAGLMTAQTLDALQHAHEAGVVHRDIKPANVIVAHNDVVKVTDFGIARAAGVARMTATGTLLGSAHYVSPEQAGGDECTSLSDVYSTGVLLYELLTGAPPFEGDSLAEIARRRLHDDVPPPSHSAPAVPPVLDRIVLRATERVPIDRFSSARAMAERLRTWESESRHPAIDDAVRPTRRLPAAEDVDTPRFR